MASCPAHEKALAFRGSDKAARARYDKRAEVVMGAGILAPLAASLAALGIAANRVGEFSVNNLLDRCMSERGCDKAMHWYRAARALAAVI